MERSRRTEQIENQGEGCFCPAVGRKAWPAVVQRWSSKTLACNENHIAAQVLTDLLPYFTSGPSSSSFLHVFFLLGILSPISSCGLRVRGVVLISQLQPLELWPLS